MKYSYEYKRKCVEMYREGKWPETPEGIQERNFHEIIRKWFRIEESCGPDALRHKMQNKVWTVEEKYELVAKVLAGASHKETAISSGIEDSLLRQWVKRYKIEGYEGLVRQRRGRPPKEASMKKKAVPAELTPSEREEKMRCFTGMRRSIPLLKSSLKRSLTILITRTTGEFKQKQNGCLLQNFGKHP